jgi:hypothetical protein
MSSFAHAQNGTQPTPSFLGPIGLNLIPTARMEEAGTLRAGIGANDPYLHGYAGAQILDDVYVQVRQSAETSSLTKTPDALHPGLDIKWRLSDEGRYQPEVVVGLNSAFGHRRTAGEYFALSKRWNDFDVTAGMGWGRTGSAGHIKNPLARLSGHFDGARDLSSDDPNHAGDWFTGRDVGFFGGVEYITPWNGVSLKADYSADRYVAETRDIAGFHRPAPWSVSVNFTPVDFISAGIGLVGTDTIMARLSFSQNIKAWPGYGAPATPVPTIPLRRTGTPDIAAAAEDAQKHDMTLTPQKGTPHLIRAALSLSSHRPPGEQIGRAAKWMTIHGGTSVESLEITPRVLGLVGRPITLSRRDIESSARHTASPEEIWHHTEFGEHADTAGWQTPTPWSFGLTAGQKTGLTEEDSGLLSRTWIKAGEQKYWGYGFVTGSSLRLNLSDNLDRLDDLRLLSSTPVRGDERLFANTRVALDTAYMAWMKTILPDTHIAATAGYLEEMFAGGTAEILWRPFGKTFAIGAEGTYAYKRDPDTSLNTGLTPQIHTAGTINLFYEIPETDVTIFAAGGKFLGGDVGATFGTMTTLNNGLRLSAYITASSHADADPYGDTLPVIAGLRLSLPIGNIPFVPDGSSVDLSFDPFARDTGQRIEKPVSLYDITEPVSYRRLAHSWEGFLN